MAWLGAQIVGQDLIEIDLVRPQLGHRHAFSIYGVQLVKVVGRRRVIAHGGDLQFALARRAVDDEGAFLPDDGRQRFNQAGVGVACISSAGDFIGQRFKTGKLKVGGRTWWAITFVVAHLRAFRRELAACIDDLVHLTQFVQHPGAKTVGHGVAGAKGGRDDERAQHQPKHDQDRLLAATPDVAQPQPHRDPVAPTHDKERQEYQAHDAEENERQVVHRDNAKEFFHRLPSFLAVIRKSGIRDSAIRRISESPNHSISSTAAGRHSQRSGRRACG